MDALILTCGGTSEPLLKAIEKFEPNLIYIIHSEKSYYVACEIIKLFENEDMEFRLKLVKDYQEIDPIFIASREVISELKESSYNIKIDFTGGAKPMSAGLILASIGQGCQYSYVGTKFSEGREKDGLGIVKNDFETILEQEDPFEKHAIFEFQRGMEFFNNFQFSSSKANFCEAKKKLKSEKLKKQAEIYENLVELYDAWDKFDMVVEKSLLFDFLENKILSEIKNNDGIKTYLNKNYPNFIPQIIKNIEFLKRKLSKNNCIKRDEIRFYLPDLLNNSCRRIKEGKFDDAVARLYRSIELVAQVQLTNEGYIYLENLYKNRNFRIEKSIINDLDDENPVKKLVKSWYEFNRESNSKTFKITLHKDFELLKALNVDFAKQYIGDKQISKNIDARNNSILAHGLKQVNEDTANELYSQVLEYAEYVFPDIGIYMDMAQFPKFENKKNMKEITDDNSC